MKYLVILLMILMVIGCSVDIVDSFIKPEDFPNIDFNYLNVYGYPDYTETVSYDNGETYERVIWDFTDLLCDPPVTVVAHSFDSSLGISSTEYGEIGTINDIIPRYIQLGGVNIVNITSDFLYYNGSIYTDNNGNTVNPSGTNYRFINTIDNTINYKWEIGVIANVILEHIYTLTDGTKFYGVKEANSGGSGFTTLSR